MNMKDSESPSAEKRFQTSVARSRTLLPVPAVADPPKELVELLEEPPSCTLKLFVALLLRPAHHDCFALRLSLYNGHIL